MPPPVPPRVKAGRMMSGKVPISSATLARFLDGVGDAGVRHVEADLDHGVLEQLAVLALLDGLGVGADHLDAVLGRARPCEERHRGVQRGLAAERRRAARPGFSRSMIFSTTSGVIGSM